MSRNQRVNTGRFALAYSTTKGVQLILNTDCADRKQLELLASDRKANGEAFPHEYIVELWADLQWFGEHTGGEKSFPAHLVGVPTA